MAKYLTNTTDLKNFILRKLGSEVHDVEITEDQWLDIFEDARRFFYDYSDYGTHEEYIVVDATGVSSIVLDETIIAIKSTKTASSYPASITPYAYPANSYLYQIMMNGSSGSPLASYVIIRQYLNMIREIMNIPIVGDYNTLNNTLYLLNNQYGLIGLEVVVEGDVDSIVNDVFFKLIVERNALEQWARNMNLKYDTSETSITGNGLKLNPQNIQDKADKLTDRIEEGIDNDEWGSSLVPRTLY